MGLLCLTNLLVRNLFVLLYQNFAPADIKMTSHGFDARAFAEEFLRSDELNNVIVGAIREALAPVVASHEAVKKELAPMKAKIRSFGNLDAPDYKGSGETRTGTRRG